MKLNKLILTCIIALAMLLAAFGVMGAISYPGTVAPSHGTVLTSTSVNFSSLYSQTNDGDTRFNVTIYNTSNSAKTGWGILYSEVIYNGSIFNRTITMKDGLRHYYYMNYTNGSSTGGHTVTPVYAFNVDTNYNRIVVGSATLNLNFTMYSGATRYSCGISPGNGSQNWNCTQY